jgi:cell division protease FtsH
VEARLVDDLEIGQTSISGTLRMPQAGRRCRPPTRPT